jgi:DNA-binding transcriptional LysR family regulator
MTPSPAELSYFIEAARIGNFSRAAALLGISQPSLSAAILRLEEALGAKLFVRSRRGVELTRPGKQLLEQAQKLLNAWDNVRTAALASLDEIQGTYSIGIHSSVAIYFLGGFLPNLLQQHPKLHINLRHDLSRKVSEAVANGELDLGIAVNPRAHPDLIISRLAFDEVTLWRKALPLNPKAEFELDNSVLIYDPDLIQTQAILKKMRPRDAPSRTIESSNLEVVCALTAAGAGVGIIPTRVVQHANVPLIKIKGAPIFRDEICVLIRKDNRKVAAIKAIVAAIKQSV